MRSGLAAVCGRRMGKRGRVRRVLFSGRAPGAGHLNRESTTERVSGLAHADGSRRGRAVQRSVRAATFVAALAACQSVPRKGVDSACDSDRNCLFGLVCRGTAVNVPGPRHCQYEAYSVCSSSSDCYRGRVCRAGHCEVQCVKDGDCTAFDHRAKPDGGALDPPKCVVGECIVPGVGKSCFSAADCAPDQNCAEGRCVAHATDRCDRDLDCPIGQRCIGGACR